MRDKKLLWSALLCLHFGLAGMQAQNTMFVFEKSGNQTPFAFTSINKLTFTAGNLTVSEKNGSTNTYALTNIRYLNFGNSTAIVEIDGKKSSNMLLFPNPVLDQLHIRYESITTGKLQLQILDVQGKVILQQTLSTHNGTNYIIIPVAKLQQGLYFCCLHNGNKFETSKFMKH